MRHNGDVSPESYDYVHTTTTCEGFWNKRSRPVLKKLPNNYPAHWEKPVSVRMFKKDIPDTKQISKYVLTSSVSRVVLCEQTKGRTDGHGETNSHFSNFAKAPKK